MVKRQAVLISSLYFSVSLYFFLSQASLRLELKQIFTIKENKDCVQGQVGGVDRKEELKLNLIGQWIYSCG